REAAAREVHLDARVGQHAAPAREVGRDVRRGHGIAGHAPDHRGRRAARRGPTAGRSAVAAGPGGATLSTLSSTRRKLLAQILGEGLTYDDVLLVPALASALPRDVSTTSRFCRGVVLQIPVASAAMDTVTDARMAVALAQQGGIGVIHKNLSREAQAREVEKVKRSAHGVIFGPISLGPDATVGEAKDLMKTHLISGLPVVDSEQRVLGILTSRDLRFVEDRSTRVRDVMTKTGLVTAAPDTTIQ